MITSINPVPMFTWTSASTSGGRGESSFNYHMIVLTDTGKVISHFSVNKFVSNTETK